MFQCALIRFVAQKIKDAKQGVAVRITGQNSQKILRVIKETRRTFSSEVNFGVEHYADQKIREYKDNGK